tara:strand:- start:726 stop:1013 length:288 start_codon:yes stop_codon:yes gene_type:complete
MTEDKDQKTNRLPNLFVGPLGQAQLKAMKFADGLSKVDSQIIIIEKMEAINEMIENTDMTDSELLLANKLLDELAFCFIDLSGDNYGTGLKEEVH